MRPDCRRDATRQERFTDDLAFGFDLASDRRVLIQRHVRAGSIIIFDEFCQYRMQVLFIENDHII